ncbi:PHP domain-containing protein [Thermodesulfobacteriota bacterium]
MDKINRIQFEKPNIAELTKDYTVVDMHFHTSYSDGTNTVKAVAGRVRKLGIGIAITDHNEIGGAIEIDAYKAILSIPGIEITSQEGAHILIYFDDIKSLKHFYKGYVRPYMGNDLMSSISLTMDEIIEKARAFKAIIIFPHPYCTAYTGVCNLQFTPVHQKRLLDAIDGIEAINSENLNRWNMRSAVLGFNLDKAITGGSDGHALYQIGKVVSYTKCRHDRKDFLEAILKKQNKVIGKEIDIFKKVKSNGLKLKTNLKNYPDLVEKNIKYSYSVINSKSKKLRDNIKSSLNRRIKRTSKR